MCQGSHGGFLLGKGDGKEGREEKAGDWPLETGMAGERKERQRVRETGREAEGEAVEGACLLKVGCSTCAQRPSSQGPEQARGVPEYWQTHAHILPGHQGQASAGA